MSQQDHAPVTTITRFRLAKYEGEHVPGDGKVPSEFVVGGDDQLTRRVTPDQAEFVALLSAERAGELAPKE